MNTVLGHAVTAMVIGAGKVMTAVGVIELAVPQVSDTAEPFRSQIRQVIRGRTEELERLAVEMYARGLSVRDIGAAFTADSVEEL